MANEEHLAILKQGVEAWNEWREKNKDTRPNLSDADLSDANLIGAHLSGADLSRANLIDANLSGAHLSRADLSDANLIGAHLSGADLSRANLIDANLSGAHLSRANLSDAHLSRAHLSRANLSDADLSDADLIDANLSGANLSDANLSDANLSSADLHGAMLYETVFANIDLSDAKGLEECRFVGPCTIDHRTIERSGGLPQKFLRGCGLPDVLIDYLPSLLDQPIQYYSCFISYAGADEQFAKRIHADLQDNGVRCWFAPEDMKIGDRVRSTIETAIRLRDKLLLILSETSIESDWVEHEVDKALEEEQQRNTNVLFPIRLDDEVMHAKFGWAKRIREAHKPAGRHIGDFTNWRKDHDAYTKSFERLLKDLKADTSSSEVK